MLRFLIASREEVSAAQLRDDLLSMLVAGHETTGSVLTWTLYLLAQHPQAMAKVRGPAWWMCVPVAWVVCACMQLTRASTLQAQG